MIYGNNFQKHLKTLQIFVYLQYKISVGKIANYFRKFGLFPQQAFRAELFITFTKF